MKKILDQIMILCCMAAALFCFTFCSDDLDIQQEYPFTVEAMPVADNSRRPDGGNPSGNYRRGQFFRNALYSPLFPA